MTTQMLRVRKGIAVEWLSVIWMVIEAGVAIGAGLAAHSLVLVAFGADSIIELVAGIVLLWRLYVEVSSASEERVERAEKIASWVVGVALLLSGGLYRCGGAARTLGASGCGNQRAWHRLGCLVRNPHAAAVARKDTDRRTDLQPRAQSRRGVQHRVRVHGLDCPRGSRADGAVRLVVD